MLDSRTTTTNASEAMMRLRMIFLGAVIVLLSCMALGLIYLFVAGDAAEFVGTRLIPIAAFTIVTLVLMFGNATFYLRRQAPHIALIGLIVTCAAWLLALMTSMADSRFGPDDELLQLLGTSWVVAIALTLGVYIWSLELTGIVPIVMQWLVLAFIGFEGLLILAYMWDVMAPAAGEFGPPTPLMIFVSGPGVLLGLVLVLVMTAVGRAQARKRKQRGESFSADVKLRMQCPQCNTEQYAPIGRIQCVSCNMTMMVEIEEPRCECGYLFYNLRGDVCPECGRPVPDEQRWDPQEEPADDGPPVASAPSQSPSTAPSE